jgi:PAS domain S-box-containing protein
MKFFILYKYKQKIKMKKSPEEKIENKFSLDHAAEEVEYKNIIDSKKFQALKDKLKLTEEAFLIKDRAIDSSINGIAISDLEGKLTYVNTSFLKLWGYSLEKDVLGKSFLNFWEEKESVAEVIGALQNHGSFVCEMVAKKKDGLKFVAELSANLINDPDGRPIRMMAS